MLHETEIRPDEIADEWTIRSEFWNYHYGSSKPKRRKRERNSAPLILCGHGVSLRVEQCALVIRDGFTHYPQDQAIYRYFPGSREIPMRILLLDGSGTLSFDVLTWLGEQSVALARVKWTGEIAAVASGSGFASDQVKVRWQHETRADEAKRIGFAADLIERKLIRGIETLERHFSDTSLRAAAIAKLNSTADRLASERFRELNEIRVLEGECAARYFDVWRELEIQWTGTGRKPIPDDWRQFTMRSSLANGIKPYNRNASHPVNAMLNYAYAVKLAHLQLQAISNGYDPTIGVMHHAREGKPSFALDLIEPERPLVDSAILNLIRSHSLHAVDFVLRSDGACRLSPQLARAVATAVA
jgi:CRISPR-associated endonuclease Cas1